MVYSKSHSVTFTKSLHFAAPSIGGIPIYVKRNFGKDGYNCGFFAGPPVPGSAKALILPEMSPMCDFCAKNGFSGQR